LRLYTFMPYPSDYKAIILRHWFKYSETIPG
jgi:hypothetical protein